MRELVFGEMVRSRGLWIRLRGTKAAMLIAPLDIVTGGLVAGRNESVTRNLLQAWDKGKVLDAHLLSGFRALEVMVCLL